MNLKDFERKEASQDVLRLYVRYEDVHRLVKSAVGRMQADGFDPDLIVAIGSGGFIPARIAKTFLNRPIYTVGISYYGMDHKHRAYPEKIQWIEEAQKLLCGKKILLIDEVDDTRGTLSYCLGELLKYDPMDIAVCVLHNKLKEKETQFPPQIKRYYPAMEVGDVWIKYPWDADDIDQHNLLACER